VETNESVISAYRLDGMPLTTIDIREGDNAGNILRIDIVISTAGNDYVIPCFSGVLVISDFMNNRDEDLDEYDADYGILRVDSDMRDAAQTLD